MEETTVSIIGIMIAAILMFIVPLFTIADRNDDIAQLTVQTETARFVDQIIRLGKINRDDYDKYISMINSSGNSYDIDMEIKILDENLSKSETINNPTSIGKNVYYSIFTSQIEDKFIDNKEIILKEGDMISITAKNNSKTLSQSLKSFYYTVTGDELHIIAGASSGTIAVNGAT